MTEVFESRTHAGLTVEIVWDEDGGSFADPQENDNAGRILSWTRDFDGDERIAEPDLNILCPRCDGEGTVNGSDEPTAPRYDQRACPECDGLGAAEIDLPRSFALDYDSALTVLLRFSDYGSSGARIYEDDSDPNCALVFTAEEIGREWNGSHEDARRYAEARIGEFDDYLQGHVYGVVVREPSEDEDERGEILESVWGYVGDPMTQPTSDYLRAEGDAMAEGCAEEIARERAEAHRWACADVETVA